MGGHRRRRTTERGRDTTPKGGKKFGVTFHQERSTWGSSRNEELQTRSLELPPLYLHANT